MQQIVIIEYLKNPLECIAYQNNFNNNEHLIINEAKTLTVIINDYLGLTLIKIEYCQLNVKLIFIETKIIFVPIMV